jgi:hypothetical protein
MGVTCACQKMESEEELITRILSSSILSETNTNLAYEGFLKCLDICVVEPEREGEGKNAFPYSNATLNLTIFDGYTKLIAGDTYRNVMIAYFKNLSKKFKNQENLKKIGAMVIFMSKGPNEDKIEKIIEHFYNFYKIKPIKHDTNTPADKMIDSEHLSENVKDMIKDIIQSNTDDLIDGFRDYLPFEVERVVTEVWKKERTNSLFLTIYSNFYSLKNKYIAEEINKIIEKNENENDLNKNFESELVEIPLDNFNENKINIKIVKEFFELSFLQLNCDYIINYLDEEYLKNKKIEQVC